MVREYSAYTVKITDEKYVSGDGKVHDKSAVVTLHNKKGTETGRATFRVVTQAEIIGMIDNGSDICLDHCYILDFSLSVYRKARGLEKKNPVVIRNFSARNAFFESTESTDFTHAAFEGSEVSFEGAHFGKGRVQFNGATFGDSRVVFSDTLFRDGNIEFTGAVFGGELLFRNAIVKDGRKDFQDVRFGGTEVSFANTEFNRGELLFINSRFSCARADFKVARIISGKVDFHYAVFAESDITFERTEFGDSRVDFRAVDFGSGKVNFNRSVFGNGEISFEGASGTTARFQFKKAVMGSGPKFFNLMELGNTEISFERTEFGNGDVSFYESVFGKLSLKSCHLDHYFDLRISKAGVLDISDTIVRDIVDLEPYDFPVRVDVLDISGMRLPGKLYISWRHNMCRNAIINQENTNLKQKSEQFRLLKENFNGTGKYEDEDAAYVMFKRFESKSWLEEQKERGKLRGQFAKVPHGFQWLVFDKIGLYATSPGRVLLSVVIFWIVFGFIYFTIESTGLGRTVSSVGNPDKLSAFLQSFYHSAITFFTIGYGDVYPMGLSRVVSGLEGFIGVFMMSYFTVAFVRKILR